MHHRFLRRAVLASALLNSVLGLTLLVAGCGSGDGRGELTPQDKQNIADENKATEEQKNAKETKVKPSA